MLVNYKVIQDFPIEFKLGLGIWSKRQGKDNRLMP